MFHTPENPYVKDAEAWGKFLLNEWSRERKKKRQAPIALPVVKQMATWAGHWAIRALALRDASR